MVKMYRMRVHTTICGSCGDWCVKNISIFERLKKWKKNVEKQIVEKRIVPFLFSTENQKMLTLLRLASFRSKRNFISFFSSFTFIWIIKNITWFSKFRVTFAFPLSIRNRFILSVLFFQCRFFFAHSKHEHISTFKYIDVSMILHTNHAAVSGYLLSLFRFVIVVRYLLLPLQSTHTTTTATAAEKKKTRKNQCYINWFPTTLPANRWNQKSFHFDKIIVCRRYMTLFILLHFLFSLAPSLLITFYLITHEWI